jgi:hypothetical protein
VLDAVGYRTREIYFAHGAGYSYAEIAEVQIGVTASRLLGGRFGSVVLT